MLILVPVFRIKCTCKHCKCTCKKPFVINVLSPDEYVGLRIHDHCMNSMHNIDDDPKKHIPSMRLYG